MKLPVPPMLLVALALAGCAADAAPPASFATRDSAGVRIVEYGNTPTGSRTFTLSEPIYRVGDEPGEPAFTNIFTGALLPDGGAVVVDGTSNQELLLITPDGGTTRLARSGRGPAEVARVVGVRALGPSSFFVLDYENEKLMIFENGVLARSLSTTSGPLAGAVPMGYEPPTTLLMMSVGAGGATQDGWTQGALMRFDFESRAFDTVAAFDRTRRRERADAIYLFGSYGLASVSGASFLTWRNDVPQVIWRSPDGAIRQVLRWKAAPSYPTQAHLDAYVEREAASARAMKPERFEIDTSQPFPLFGAARGDGQGGVWLSDARPDTGAAFRGPPRYTLIAPDGEWLGPITLPERFQLLDVIGDRVLGVLRDELDVESVAVFSVIPSVALSPE